MIAYGIKYTIRSKKDDGKLRDALVEARDMKSAKNKLAKKHGYKDGRMIKIESISVIGYF